MLRCPECQAETTATMERCFQCGRALRGPTTLVRGSLVAGRYEILAPLGQGGMGMVYKARDHQLEEVVAIKVLRPDVAADPEMERRFRTEIRLARKVRHRNVCGIYEYGDDAGLRYIAMEYVEGVDLRKLLLERGGLPADQAFDTCIRVAEGLQAIHDAGIVHRDLKPANLMRDARGETRLMDFGIAKQVGVDAAHGGTVTGLLVGTPEYMSPEQARGVKIDHRSDVYALGIVTFEVFSGHVPFRGETPIATIFKHLQEPPPLDGPLAAGLPASLVPVLQRALAKEADERFGSAAEFGQALAAARDAAGVAPGGSRTPLPLPGAARTDTPPTLAVTAEARASTATPPPAPTQAARTPTPTATLVDARRAGSAPKRRHLILAAVAALALGVVTLGALALVRLLVSRTRAGASVAVGTLPARPDAGPRGTLVIDALPWGEVARVSDARGTAQPLPAERVTPLALPLAAGEYVVEVRHPAFPQTLTARVRVMAERAQTHTVVFRRVDAAEYFRRTGS